MPYSGLDQNLGWDRAASAQEARKVFENNILPELQRRTAEALQRRYQEQGVPKERYEVSLLPPGSIVLVRREEGVLTPDWRLAHIMEHKDNGRILVAFPRPPGTTNDIFQNMSEEHHLNLTPISLESPQLWGPHLSGARCKIRRTPSTFKGTKGKPDAAERQRRWEAGRWYGAIIIWHRRGGKNPTSILWTGGDQMSDPGGVEDRDRNMEAIDLSKETWKYLLQHEKPPWGLPDVPAMIQGGKI